MFKSVLFFLTFNIPIIYIQVYMITSALCLPSSSFPGGRGEHLPLVDWGDTSIKPPAMAVRYQPARGRRNDSVPPWHE